MNLSITFDTFMFEVQAVVGKVVVAVAVIGLNPAKILLNFFQVFQKLD
jgi:hypothetical protein